MPAEHLPALITSLFGGLSIIFGFIQWQRGRMDTIQRERVAEAVEKDAEDREELQQVNEGLLETNKGLQTENSRLRQLVGAHEVDWFLRWGWMTAAYTRLLQLDPTWPAPPRPTGHPSKENDG